MPLIFAAGFARGTGSLVEECKLTCSVLKKEAAGEQVRWWRHLFLPESAGFARKTVMTGGGFFYKIRLCAKVYCWQF